MANIAPLAPTLTAPPNNGYLIVSEPNVFAWTFNDPGDIQSAAWLRFKKAGDPGWTNSPDVATIAGTYTLPPDSWEAGFVYEWQILTYDYGSITSPWSTSRFVNTIEAMPAPTITAPAEAAVISESPLLVEWTPPAGFGQDAYRLVVSVGQDYDYNSGVVESTATRSALVPLPSGSGFRVVSLEIGDNGHWSTGDVAITLAILPPETPLILLEQVEGKPEVVISVTNPAASDAEHLATVSNSLTRNGVPIATGLAPNAEFTDRLVGGGEVDYRAVAKTASGGTATSF